MYFSGCLCLILMLVSWSETFKCDKISSRKTVRGQTVLHVLAAIRVVVRLPFILLLLISCSPSAEEPPCQGDVWGHSPCVLDCVCQCRGETEKERLVSPSACWRAESCLIFGAAGNMLTAMLFSFPFFFFLECAISALPAPEGRSRDLLYYRDTMRLCIRMCTWDEVHTKRLFSHSRGANH